MTGRSAGTQWIRLGIVLCLFAAIALVGCTSAPPAPPSSTQPAVVDARPTTSSASTGTASSVAPQRGGILRMGEKLEGISLGYPPKLTAAQSNRQAAPAVENLLHYDTAGKPVPWLATGYKVDVAAKTITLTLRNGVKFHDGTDFNAEAVKWNLEQHIQNKVATTTNFKSIDVIDDFTVRINLSTWDSTTTSNLAGTLGMMVSPAATQKNGVEWAQNHPVGTGPFEFVSWQKNVSIKYKKFDGYWQKGKPYLDGIEINVTADALTRELSFRAGELDVLTSPEASVVTKLEKDGYSVRRNKIGSGGYGMVPESANPDSPWSKLQVRQAAQYAIDSAAILKTLYSGEGEVPTQWAYKGHWAHNPSVVGYPYNPEKAKQLLAEAGYPNGFKTKIMYAKTVDRDLLYASVQDYLKAVGIDATLDATDYGRYNPAIYGGKWDGLIQGSPSGDPELVGQLRQRFGGTGWYAQMLVPDDYKKAVEAAVAAPDFETQQKAMWDVQKLMIDKYALVLMLYMVNDFTIGKDTVHDTSLLETPMAGQWRPEDAWLSSTSK